MLLQDENANKECSDVKGTREGLLPEEASCQDRRLPRPEAEVESILGS